MLIDGYKFDLRLYVLLTSCDPLRIFLFKDGLVRICTKKYQPPNSQNSKDSCIHLTNYSVNKHNENFVFNNNAKDDGIGNKRSLKWFFNVNKQLLIQFIFLGISSFN